MGAPAGCDRSDRVRDSRGVDPSSHDTVPGLCHPCMRHGEKNGPRHAFDTLAGSFSSPTSRLVFFVLDVASSELEILAACKNARAYVAAQRTSKLIHSVALGLIYKQNSLSSSSNRACCVVINRSKISFHKILCPKVFTSYLCLVLHAFFAGAFSCEARGKVDAFDFFVSLSAAVSST